MSVMVEKTEFVAAYGFWSKCKRAHRRGNVLIEFVLVIPLLATIIGLTFFFGWAMTNQQHVKISDWFQAWRGVRKDAVASEAQLNAWFFQDRADEEDLRQEGGTGPTGAMEDFVAAVANRTARGGNMARMLAMEDHSDRFPHGKRAFVAAEFPSNIGIYQQFGGAIQNEHTRDGVEWRRGQARCERALRDEFYPALDDIIGNLPGGLGEVIRDLYLSRW